MSQQPRVNPLDDPPRTEIVLFQTPDGQTRIDVRMVDETVWLSQAQMVELFQSSKANVSEHINHIFEEGELEEAATVRKFRTVQNEAGRRVSRDVTYYNLDVIISVGYRVRSLRGTQFRRWALAVLREYLVKGFAMNDNLLKATINVTTIPTAVPKTPPVTPIPVPSHVNKRNTEPRDAPIARRKAISAERCCTDRNIVAPAARADNTRITQPTTVSNEPRSLLIAASQAGLPQFREGPPAQPGPRGLATCRAQPGRHPAMGENRGRGIQRRFQECRCGQ